MTDLMNPTSCQDFELLISCALDEELSYQQQAWVAEHLVQCAACRLRQERFEDVDGLIGRLGDLAGEENARPFVVPAVRATKPVQPKRIVARQNILRGSLAIVTIALGFVAAALFLNLTLEKKAQAEDIVAPMVSLAEINDQRVRDQEMLKESLQLELRTLRLQLASLLAEDSSGKIRQKLDALSEEVKKFEVTNLKSNEEF